MQVRVGECIDSLCAGRLRFVPLLCCVDHKLPVLFAQGQAPSEPPCYSDTIGCARGENAGRGEKGSAEKR